MPKASLALALVALLMQTAPARAADNAKAPKYRIQWLLGHKNLDFFEEAAKDFKRSVETRSQGRIQVDIVQESADASPAAPEIAGKVSRGEAQMGHSFTDVMGALDPQLYAFETPYLMRDYSHMEGVLDGPVGQQMLDGLKAQHLVGLGFTYSGGANGIASVDRPLRKPADLKGLRVGVYGDAVNAAWLESLGAKPVALAHDLDRINELVSRGELDAVAITWRNFQRSGLEARFKYFNMPGSSYLVSMTYVNDKFFASLPKELQAMLVEESRKAGRIERAKTIKLNQDSMVGLMAKGVEPVQLTAAQKGEFSRALKPAYEKIDGLLGRKLLESIKKAPDGAPSPLIPDGFAKR
jgi:C4-dicarboxylate-binding protein DctP